MDTQKVERFAQILQDQTRAELHRQKMDFVADTCITQIHYAKKYTRVDIGPAHNMSGRYMIENETGNIFGIKAYGVIHRGHFYGTLDTIEDYFWGSYRGIKLAKPLTGTEGQDRENYTDEQDRESYISK